MEPCAHRMVTALLASAPLAWAQTPIDPSDARVRAWVEQCERLNGIEIDWTETQDVLLTNGEFAYSFDVGQTVRVRWPNAVTLSTRVVETGEVLDSTAALRFDRDFIITGSGVVSENYLRHSENNTAMVGPSAPRLGVVPASFAPGVLGLWMKDQKPETVTIEERSADSFRVHLTDLRMRAVVERRGIGDGPGAMVVTRLEYLPDGDTPNRWWEYDDFARVEGGGVVGRTMVGYSTLDGGRIHEAMPSVVAEVRTIGPGEPVAFEELAAKGEDLLAARWNETPPSRRTGRSGRRALAAAGPVVLWLGAGGLLVAGVAVVIGRARS